jgi:hypothetical protein
VWLAAAQALLVTEGLVPPGDCFVVFGGLLAGIYGGQTLETGVYRQNDAPRGSDSDKKAFKGSQVCHFYRFKALVYPLLIHRCNNEINCLTYN